MGMRRLVSVTVWVAVLAVVAGTTSAAAAPTQAAWGYGTLGSGIGLSGVLTARNGATTEIYVGGGNSTFGANTTWQALTYSPATHSYEQVFVSESLPQGIRQLALWHLQDRPAPVILVALNDGTVLIHDLATKGSLGSFTDPCSSLGGLKAFITADLNGDGNDELISVCGDGRLQAYGVNYDYWSVAAVGGTSVRLVVGQMDDDAALEIASTTGKVIDTSSHAVQWTRTGGFGNYLQAVDVDADGRDELIAGFNSDGVWSYDVERQLPKWHVPEFDIDAILVTDVNQDGVKDLVIGDGQWGDVHAYNTVTLQPEWAIANPEHGVANLTIADVDGDGIQDVVWGAGYSSTGADHLYVGHWATQTIAWESEALDGPFLGPEVGDLDGDGIPEIVVASFMSESGYDSGRIIVFDSRNLKVRAIWRGVAGGNNGWTGIHDLKLRDLNKDGRLEILVATDWLYDGVIEAYRFSPSNVFTKVFSNATRPVGAPFYSVDALDIDGDGSIEVLGGVGRAHSGAVGSFVYAYDAATGQQKWSVPVQVPNWEPLTQLVISDFDLNGHLDVAAVAKGAGIYIFDGVTRQYDAIIETPATATSAVAPPQIYPFLLTGTTAGHVNVRQWDPSQVRWTDLNDFALVTTEVSGVHYSETNTLWVGSGGRLRRYSTDYFETLDYGAGFGSRLLTVAGSVVLSTGDHGIHAFVTHP